MTTIETIVCLVLRQFAELCDWLKIIVQACLTNENPTCSFPGQSGGKPKKS